MFAQVNRPGTSWDEEMETSMRPLLLVVTAVLIVAAAPRRSLPPPTLWNGITDGMSVSAILSKNPGAEEEGGDIVLRPIVVDGLTYFPTVKVAGGKAFMVTLGTSRGNADEFLAALSGKYGRPIQPWGCINQNGAETCQAYWNGARGLRVTLTYLGLFGRGEIKISYRIANSVGL